MIRAIVLVSLVPLAISSDAICESPELCQQQSQALLQVGKISQQSKKTDSLLTEDAEIMQPLGENLLTEDDYQKVASLCCSDPMIAFIKQVIDNLGYELCSPGGVSGIAVWYDCTDDKNSYASLVAAVKKGLQGECPFIGPTKGVCPPRPASCDDVAVQGDFLPCTATTTVAPPPPVTTTAVRCGPLDKEDNDRCVAGTTYATGDHLKMKRCKSKFQLEGPGGAEDWVAQMSEADCANRCDSTDGCVGFDLFTRNNGKKRCSLCKDLPDKCLEPDQLTQANNNGVHYYKSSGCPATTTVAPPPPVTTTAGRCGPLEKELGDRCIAGTTYATGDHLKEKRCKTPFQLADSEQLSEVDCANLCDSTDGCVGFDLFNPKKNGKRRCSLCKDLPNKCLEPDQLNKANNGGVHYYKSSGCP